MKPVSFISLACLTFSFLSCKYQEPDNVLIVQPLGSFPARETAIVYNKLKGFYPHTVLKRPVALPHEAYYAPRNRFRADSVIRELARTADKHTIIIGLTDEDISTSKGAIKDWGVMGLGYRPGKACVVSTFRLNKSNLSNQFYKVVIHEIGHTLGLPHCKERTCFMRDAEGGNPLDEETAFCSDCIFYEK